MIKTSVVLLSFGAFAAAALAAEEQPVTPANAKRVGVWWQWDVNRQWSSHERRAWGIIKLYSDAAKTKPLKVDSLRYTLEVDCPSTGAAEKVINETRDASQLTGEVLCQTPTTGDYEVRWSFEAEDPRTGLIKDSGVSK
jgi:hypothetical protein